MLVYAGDRDCPCSRMINDMYPTIKKENSCCHHATPIMSVIAALREKYDLHMMVERFADIEENESDERFFRK